MYLAISKKAANDKKEVCKEFMTFALQPKYIRNFTVVSGGVMPYDVDFTTEDYAQMSTFTKSFLQLYQDDNNTIVRTTLLENTSDWLKSGGAGTSSNGTDYVILSGLYKYSSADYLSKMNTTRENNWATYLESYNAYKN